MRKSGRVVAARPKARPSARTSVRAAEALAMTRLLVTASQKVGRRQEQADAGADAADQHGDERQAEAERAGDEDQPLERAGERAVAP